MSAILLLGFLVGMRHAMEGDHLAAVATLATRSHSLGHTVWQGAVWGLGHTVTLFAVCSMVLFLDAVIPERLALGLEAAVGAMLVLLGLDVIRRLTQERIHFHTHRHQDGTTHMHAHSHQGGGRHDCEHHQHAHPRRFPLRALLVGLVHGMAGSAALILLTLPTATSPLLGLGYVAVFGLGSIAGMALLSAVIAVPLRYSARAATWVRNGLHATIGAMTIGIGMALLYESARLLSGAGI